MKKILTLLTGIVFLITILIAGGCKSAGDNDQPILLRGEVTIYLMEAFEKNGKKHLRMYDSNNPDIIVVDTLETLVKPGTKVIWVALDESGIEKLKKIGPKQRGDIIRKDAAGFLYTLFTKKKKLKIPDNAPIPSEREKYDIKFKYKDGKTWTIDPYLKIPR